MEKMDRGSVRISGVSRGLDPSDLRSSRPQNVIDVMRDALNSIHWLKFPSVLQSHFFLTCLNST